MIIQQEVDAQFVALQQLTSLTKLCIWKVSNSVAVQLAALQTLEHLRLESSSLNDLGLLALTALRRLTELRVTSASFSADLTQRLTLLTVWGLDSDNIYHIGSVKVRRVMVGTVVGLPASAVRCQVPPADDLSMSDSALAT